MHVSVPASYWQNQHQLQSLDYVWSNCLHIFQCNTERFLSPSPVSELLRSRWNLCGGTLVFKQGACSHSGTAFFMSETEHACSRLCHPLFSRQKIPKNPQPRSFYLTDSANIQPKCLSTSTAACQTSSIATRCPVWLPRYQLVNILNAFTAVDEKPPSPCWSFRILCRDFLDFGCLSFCLWSRLKAKETESRRLLSTWLMLQRHWTGLQPVSNSMQSIIKRILEFI